MVHIHKPGSPLPFGRAAIKPAVIVAEAGQFDQDDGIRLVLSESNLVFLGAFDNTSFAMNIDIDDLLGVISKHTRATAS